MTALISHQYCFKNRESQNIQELYPIILATPQAAQKKRSKIEKKVKKAENSPTPPLAQDKEFIALTPKKSKQMKYHFKISVIMIFSREKGIFTKIQKSILNI